MTMLKERLGELRVHCEDFRLPAPVQAIFTRLANDRHNLFSAAANAVSNLVRKHVARESQMRHSSASRLGAQPTGHLEKGARAVTFAASPERGEVIIPIPGASRAFRDVTITPQGRSALTLPIDHRAYGRRAAEMESLGWKLFMRRGKSARGILFGERDGETVPLYVLKKRVTQRQDRSLLPSDPEIIRTASKAILDWVGRPAA